MDLLFPMYHHLITTTSTLLYEHNFKTKSSKMETETSVFVAATRRQRFLAWNMNASSWADQLSPEAYVIREQLLSSTLLSSFPPNGTRCLVLYPETNPEDVKSSLDATLKEVLVASGTKRGERRKELQ